MEGPVTGVPRECLYFKIKFKFFFEISKGPQGERKIGRCIIGSGVMRGFVGKTGT